MPSRDGAVSHDDAVSGDEATSRDGVVSRLAKHLRNVGKRHPGAPPQAKRADPINPGEVPSRRDQSSSLTQIVAVVYALVLGQSFLQEPTLFEHPLDPSDRTTLLAILVVFVGVAWQFLSYSLNMGRFPYRVRWTDGTSDTGTEEGRFAVDLAISLAYAGLLLTALRTEDHPESALIAFFVFLIIVDILDTTSDYLAMFKWDIPGYRVVCHLPIPTGVLFVLYWVVWSLPLAHQALINQLFLVLTIVMVICRELLVRKTAQQSFDDALEAERKEAALAQPVAATTAVIAPTKDAGRPRIYAAGPLGFTPYGAHYHSHDVLQRLRLAGFEVADPWVAPPDAAAVYAQRGTATLQDLRIANQKVGLNNIALIDSSVGMLAVLDGTDVDSGTASEIGYAAAQGKTVVGLRLDSRNTGDNRAAQVNLQVEAFIEQNGGEIVRSLDEAIALLQQLFGTT